MSSEEIKEQQAESMPDHLSKPKLITLCTRHGEILEEHGVTIKNIETIAINISKKLDGVLLGDIKDPGIISRITGLENFRAIHLRIYWIAGTVTVTALTTWILVLSKVIHR